MNGDEQAQGLVATTVIVVTPATINIGGYQPEVVGLALSMITVVTVRMLFGFSDRGEGAFRREVLRTIIAAVFVFGYDLTYRPGPGLAVVVGAGVGVSIATLLDIAGEGVVGWLKRLFGKVVP